MERDNSDSSHSLPLFNRVIGMIIQPNNSRTNIFFTAEHVDARKRLTRATHRFIVIDNGNRRFRFAHFDLLFLTDLAVLVPFSFRIPSLRMRERTVLG